MLSLALVLLGILLLALGAGVLGSLLGLGGGLVIVPGLVLLFGVDVHFAVACSLISVIATSAGSASRYASRGLLHLRLGFFLEIATAVGALFGAFLTAFVLLGPAGSEVLYVAFAAVCVSAMALLYRDLRRGQDPAPPPDPLADRWRLHGVAPPEGGLGATPFRVGRVRTGMALAFVAGCASGLLGIGGGIYKVPAMTSVMGVPIKVASATSSLMIGVTAVAGALVYLAQGDVLPLIVAPVAVGTLGGTFLGTRLHALASTRTLKLAFILVLLAAALIMVLRGLGVSSL